MQNSRLTMKKTGIAILSCACIVAGSVVICQNVQNDHQEKARENAIAAINGYMEVINPKSSPIRRGTVEQNMNAADELPDLTPDSITVTATTDTYAEVYSSFEKGGTGVDGWLSKVVEMFNDTRPVINGKPVSIQLRKVPSGLAADYISTGKYHLDGYTPANSLWNLVLESRGFQTQLLDESLADNWAGVLVSKEKAGQMEKEYGTLNLEKIVRAMEKGDFRLGYSSPYTSSCGLNFLLTTLQMLTDNQFDTLEEIPDEISELFASLRQQIPFIGFTTDQLRETAATQNLDGFLMEYQSFLTSERLQDGYVFVPFGYPQNNPLYICPDISDEKRMILEAFCEYLKQDEIQELAASYDFNTEPETKADFTPEPLSEEAFEKAMELWKVDSMENQKIHAVFVVDVSRSMQNEPLQKLKTSLLHAMSSIDENASIGLVSFNEQVTIDLPLSCFDQDQQEKFIGAICGLEAAGGTATFDGIITAAHMLLEEQEKEQDPEIREMIFVLSDGINNQGYSLQDIEGPIHDLGIPIYTISYNEDVPALERLAEISGGAAISASTDNLLYQLKSLFNASL